MFKILRPARRGVARFLQWFPQNQNTGSADLTIPQFTLQAYGRRVRPNEAELTVPEVTLDASSGGSLDVVLEDLTLDASGSNTNIGRANLIVSPFTLAATGLTGALGTAAPVWNARATLDAAGGANADLTVPKALLSAAGTTGSVGTASLVVPSFSLAAGGTQGNLGSANLTVPEFQILWGQASLVVPAFTLQASGGEVIAASANIAYSVNLSHGGLTRYPGFSFDHILKQGGKYYGVRSDGVYLLEGTSDDGTAIDVLLKTSDMDLGNAHAKRVPYIYTGSANVINIKTLLDGAAVGPVQSKFNNRRTRLGRGVAGQYVAVEITNEAGNEFKLDDVELLVETKSRRAF